MTAIAIIMLGFFLGMRHATDADHVIAVTTIVSRQRSVRYAALIGVLWGCGHTLTIFVVGSAIILFGVVIPPRLGLTMELSVGLMLIVLGILNLSGIMRWITETFTPGAGRSHLHVHSHAHAHGDFVHEHAHSHEVLIAAEGAPPLGATLSPERASSVGAAAAVETVQADETGAGDRGEDAAPVGWMDRQFKNLGAYQIVRPLVVGIVHGLAGSAAVALLVLTTIRDPYWAIVYLLVFGIGTIAGMMMITAAIALPFTYSGEHFSRINRGLGIASGLISLGFGLFIVYQMGYVNGILTSHPNWTPH